MASKNDDSEHLHPEKQFKHREKDGKTISTPKGRPFQSLDTTGRPRGLTHEEYEAEVAGQADGRKDVREASDQGSTDAEHSRRRKPRT